MRLPSSAYPREEKWWEWVTIEKGETISLVFAQRLAGYAKNILKRKLVILSGFRSYEQQAALYKAYLAGLGPPAAPPGSSWHEFYCAVDVKGPKDLWPEILADYTKNPSLQKMHTYGIALSNWIGSASGVHEWWHIVPFECVGYTGKRSEFLDPDDRIVGEEDMLKRGDTGPNVKSWQNVLIYFGSTIAVDGSFGPATEAATKDFQTKNGLNPTGVVDTTTFCKALDLLLDAISKLQASYVSLTEELLAMEAAYDETMIALTASQAEVARLSALITDFNTALANLNKG